MIAQTKKNEALKLVLENKQGQKVRTINWTDDTLYLIFNHESRRVESHIDLHELEEREISFTVLKEIKRNDIGANGILVPRIGRVRFESDHDIMSPEAELSDDDKEEMTTSLKRSFYVHSSLFLLLLCLSFFAGNDPKTLEEPNLVQIPVPKKEEVVTPKSVAVSEVRIVPRKIPPRAKIVNHPVPHPKLMTHHERVRPQKHAKVANVQKQHTVYSHNSTETIEMVGALGALGGLKNGKKGAAGLDLNSMKNIRGAGVGSGGGGVGSGLSGGIRTVLPGSGLVAGSVGNGGRAQSAGGYGTKGIGGGRAGYGKINMVGSLSGITLPVDEEAVIQGGLDRDQIAAVINKHMGQIVYCYEQGLQSKPELTGRVSIRFVIGPKGVVSTAGVAHSSLHNSQVESCVVSKMRGWKFPQPVGNVSVNVLYPFDLRRVTQN